MRINTPEAITGILGIATALISWRQYASSREQIRIALFDKRYKVYAATKRFIATILQNDRVEDKDFLAFWRNTSDCGFLFPSAMRDLLERIQEAASNKRMLARKCEHARQVSLPSEEVDILIDGESSETMILSDFLRGLEDEFMPYLDFKEFQVNPARRIHGKMHKTLSDFVRLSVGRDRFRRDVSSKPHNRR
jgi:hypothetical protein